MVEQSFNQNHFTRSSANHPLSHLGEEMIPAAVSFHNFVTPALVPQENPNSTVRNSVSKQKPQHRCAYAGCEGKTFGRQVELRRHCRTFHGDDQDILWCPVDSCSRSRKYGGRPFPGARPDKLQEHIRKIHASVVEEREQQACWFANIGPPARKVR